MSTSWRAMVLFWIAWQILQPARLQAQQADRRSRKEPDIFLNTGGRTGTLDVLTFTDDFVRVRTSWPRVKTRWSGLAPESGRPQPRGRAAPLVYLA